MYYWVLLILGPRRKESKKIVRKVKEIAPKLPPPPPPSPKTKTQKNPIAVEEQQKLKKESKRGKKEAKCRKRYTW